MNNIKFIQKNTSWALLLVIILIGAFLRLYKLGEESYWLDEIIMLHVAGGSLDTILNHSAIGRPPLFVTIAHFWMCLFGTTEVAARSLPAIFGIASIIAIYTVAKQLFGKRVGIVSSFLFSVSYFPIYHSQEFRYYSLFIFLVLMSFYFFIRLLNDRSWKSSILYSIFSALLFYSHTFGIFVIFAQNIYLLLQPKILKSILTRWLVSQLIVLIFISPGIYIAFFKVIDQGGGADWIPYPQTWLPLDTLKLYISQPIYFMQYGKLSLIPILAYAFFIIIYSIIKGNNSWNLRMDRFLDNAKKLKNKTSHIFLVSLWLIIPIVLPYVLSFLIGPMYLHRYTIAASPALFILLAVAIVMLKEIVPEVITIACLLIIISPCLHRYFNSNTKENWREVAVYVEKESKEKDTIILLDLKKEWARKSFYWYYKGNIPGCSIQREAEYDEIDKAFSKCIINKDRFWLIMRRSPDSIDITPFYKYFLYSNDKRFKLKSHLKYSYIWVVLFELKI